MAQILHCGLGTVVRLAVGDPKRRVVVGRIVCLDLGALKFAAEKMIELTVGELVQRRIDCLCGRRRWGRSCRRGRRLGLVRWRGGGWGGSTCFVGLVGGGGRILGRIGSADSGTIVRQSDRLCERASAC